MGPRSRSSNQPSATSMVSMSPGNRSALCDWRTAPSPLCGRSGWPSPPIRSICRCTAMGSGVIQRRHGHLSPHVVMVLDGEIMCGDRRCPAGTHIELPQGAAFGPFEAGPEGATLFEVMMGDPRGWGDDPASFERLLKQRGVDPLPDPPIELPPWLEDLRGRWVTD